MTATISLEQHKKEIEELHIQINFLNERLNWFQRQVFGQRSEKIVADFNSSQLKLELGFVEPSKVEEKQPVRGFERRKSNRNGQDKISFPDDLPVEKVIVDLPEDEKKCQETGLPLVKIGEEITRKLATKPGSFYIKEIIRFKYALPVTSCESGVRTALLPEGLLTRCQADESFLADILVKKFADHLPLYRISEILERENISISRQTLCQWVIRVGKALKPLYDEMGNQVLQSNNLFVDETPINMLSPGKGKVHQAYMWVLVGGKEANPAYRIYNFRTNRQHSNAANILKGYKGTLHSDKYGAYENLANTKQFTWCPCWVHIRRKFLEESGDPEFRQWVLRKIRYLYMFEKIAWKSSPEKRLQIRQEKEIPIINELITKIKNKLVNGNVLPKSKFKEALGYFVSLIPYLKNYILDPWARMDNNIAERAVRPLALGRKNWMFVGNEDGGEAAAVILSLIQTCRALEINPREYLEDVMRRLMSHNAQKLYELLPDNWAKSKSKIQ